MRNSRPKRRSISIAPGRGVSWHEFDLAFGMENIEVVLDGYSTKAKKQNSYRPNEAFEAALAAVFAEQNPPVPARLLPPVDRIVVKLKAT